MYSSFIDKKYLISTLLFHVTLQWGGYRDHIIFSGILRLCSCAWCWARLVFVSSEEKRREDSVAHGANKGGPRFRLIDKAKNSPATPWVGITLHQCQAAAALRFRVEQSWAPSEQLLSQERCLCSLCFFIFILFSKCSCDDGFAKLPLGSTRLDAGILVWNIVLSWKFSLY